MVFMILERQLQKMLPQETGETKIKLGSSVF